MSAFDEGLQLIKEDVSDNKGTVEIQKRGKKTFVNILSGKIHPATKYLLIARNWKMEENGVWVFE